MKAFAKKLKQCLGPLTANQQAGPVHICMYLALLQYSGGRAGWFFIDVREVMELAKVRGVRTYYRVMRDLVEMGVLEYWASRNGETGSRVKIC